MSESGGTCVRQRVRRVVGWGVQIGCGMSKRGSVEGGVRVRVKEIEKMGGRVIGLGLGLR